MALDDYFNDPSQECLARLFDAINSMDLSAAPSLSRHEKLIMRTSDRKDVFAEKFAPPPARPGSAEHSETLVVPVGGAPPPSASLAPRAHRSTVSWDSRASDEGIVLGPRARAGTESDVRAGRAASPPPPPPRADSFSLDGSAVWVEGDSTLDAGTPQAGGPGLARRNTHGRSRRSTDASSSSDGRKEEYFPSNGVLPPSMPGASSTSLVKDTRSYQTFIAYKGHQLPIKMPVDTFPEEVGDVSISHGRFTDCNVDEDLLVFTHPAHHDLYVVVGECTGTPSPASALERPAHTTDHRPFQRSDHRQAYHLPGPRTSRRTSLQPCPCCLRTCIRMWRRSSWVH
jgi:hypothetical protein